MALTEKVVFTGSWLEDGQIQVLKSRKVYDGIELIGEKLHRHVLEPGQDVSGEDIVVRRVSNALWTPQVVSDFLAAKAARQASL